MQRLLQAISGEMTRRSLRAKPGLKNPAHFRKTYLNPAIQAGFIEAALPGKPRSRFQRYCLAPVGQAALARAADSNTPHVDSPVNPSRSPQVNPPSHSPSRAVAAPPPSETGPQGPRPLPQNLPKPHHSSGFRRICPPRQTLQPLPALPPHPRRPGSPRLRRRGQHPSCRLPGYPPKIPSSQPPSHSPSRAVAAPPLGQLGRNDAATGTNRIGQASLVDSARTTLSAPSLFSCPVPPRSGTGKPQRAAEPPVDRASFIIRIRLPPARRRPNRAFLCENPVR